MAYDRDPAPRSFAAYPLDAGGKPRFRLSVVLFLDLLGSQELARAEDAESNLQRLFEALAFAENFGLTNRNADWRAIATFTDHVALGWPIREDAEGELGGTIAEVAYYQFALARFGFFARGGIALGDVFFAPAFVFGPALIDAHELESRAAIYPRVVLSDLCIELAKLHGNSYGHVSRSPYEEELLWASDKLFFVNYLGVLNDQEMSPRDEMHRHKQHVEAGLRRYEDRPAIREKYQWLVDYHNHVCAVRFPADPDLRIQGIAAVHSFGLVSKHIED